MKNERGWIMHKLLIVEDDQIQNFVLLEGIKQEYPYWNIFSATTYEEAFSMLTKSIQENDLFSLFLLDIQLTPQNGDTGGFYLAEQIRSYKQYFKTPILFLTSVHEKTQYALSTYHCYNYITKPYEIDDILYQIEQMIFTGYLDANSIRVSDTNGINHRIMLSELQYIELKSHQAVFYTFSGDIHTRKNISSDLLQELDQNFVQCHKKYIININYVQSYAKTNRYINISNSIIPVSRTYKSNIEHILLSKNIL